MSEEDDIELVRERERLMPVGDRLRRTGIPRRYLAKGLPDYAPVPETERAYEACTQYVAWFQQHWDDGVGLALIGDPGTTKTTLACLTALELARIGYLVRYTTLDGYVRDLKARMDLDRLLGVESEKAQALTDLAASREREWTVRRAAYLLVVDDVGKEYRAASGFAAGEWDSLFRERYDRGLPTILTSNVPTERWADEYSPAMRSFVFEACQVIRFGGFDARGRNAVRAGR